MYPIAHIIWHDAGSPPSGWMDKDEFLEHCTIMQAETVGFIIAVDEQQIKVCQSFFPLDQQMGEGIAIPTRWITSLTYLTLPHGVKGENIQPAREPNGPSTVPKVHHSPPKDKGRVTSHPLLSTTQTERFTP